MAGATKTLTLELVGKNTGLTRVFNDSGNKIDAFQKKVKASNDSLISSDKVAKGAAAGVAALAAGLTYAISKAVAFDKAMRNVNSLTKLNEQQFAAMEKQVISMSKELPQSASVLAEGLYDIASSGFQGADGIKVLDAAARSASAGLTSTATSAGAITAVLNAYGLQAKDAADVSDTLFSTVNLGVISFEELANNLGDVVGATAAAKIGIDQVGAAIATMTLSGIKGAAATTALSSLTTKLVQPSDALADLYERLGYESGETALKTKGLRGVLEDVRKATGGNITAMLELFPDIEAARGALALMANDGANYAKVSDQITDKTKRQGATQAVLNEQMKSVSAQWQLFMNQIDAAAISMGVRLLPSLTKAMELTQDFGAAIGKVALELKERAGSGLDSFGDAISNVIDLLQEVGSVVLSIAEPLSKLAAGAVIETFNALAGVLADVTGLAADNQTAVIALGLAYAVHASGGIGTLVSGMGTVSDLLKGKFTPGMYDAAEGVLSLGDKVKGVGAQLLQFAPAAAVGGTLAVATTAWASYSEAAGKAGDVTEGVQKVMNSFNVDEITAELKKANEFIDEYDRRMDEFGQHTGFADFATDIANFSKNWGTLAMGENLDEVQAAADRASQRIGNLQYNTVKLYEIVGKPLPDKAKWINDVQGANGVKAQTEAMRQMQTVMDTMGPKLKAIGIDMGTSWSAEQITAAGVALKEVGSKSNVTADAQKNLIDKMGVLSTSMGSAEDAADGLKTALDKLTGASIGLDEAQIAWLNGLAALSKSLKENGTNLTLNTQKGRDNRSAVIGQVDALQDLLVASAQAGEGAGQLTSRMTKGREALIKAGQGAGIKRAAMVALLAQYKLTPELVQTIIKEHGGKDVKQALKDLKKEADELGAKRPTPQIKANIAELEAKLKTARAKLDDEDLTKDRRAALKANISDLEQKIASAKATLASMPKDKTTNVKTSGIPTARREISDFANSTTRTLRGIADEAINVGIKYSSKGINLSAPSSVGRRATGGPGGPVHGPGTGTSDEAGLYRLSNDEHVLTAAEVKAAGGHRAIIQLRQMLLKGFPGFATGGGPGVSLRASTANPSSLPPQIAAQLLAMAKPFIAAGAKQLEALGGPAGPPGSAMSFRGKRLNQRTIAMLLNAERMLGAAFHITQGSYSTSVAASGSTHAGGGAMDTNGPGGWGNAVSALRRAGFAAWHRTPSQGPWGHHIHAIARGDSSASPAAKRQVADFERGGDGLGGGGGRSKRSPAPSRPTARPTGGRDLTRFDDGGFYLPKHAKIQPGKGSGLVQWAERETDGEAFIPLANSKRGRSEKILAQVADKFGLGLVQKFADGGFRYPTFKFAYPKFEWAPEPGASAKLNTMRRAAAVRSYNWNRARDRREKYNEWLDNRRRAYEEYEDRMNLLSQARGRSGEGVFRATRDVGSTLTGLTTSREARSRAHSEYTARTTSNTHDTAEDYYRKPTTSVTQYTAALKASVAEQQRWASEVSAVTRYAGGDVVKSLLAMGEEGEAIVKKMAHSTGSQIKAMADQIRSVEFGKLLGDTRADVQAQATFQANLQTLVKMGRADLAAQFSEMGYAQAGAAAAGAVRASGAQLDSLAFNLRTQDALSDPNSQKAFQLASLLQTSGGKLGIVGLSRASGMSVADVMGLLQTYGTTVFGKVPAAAMLAVRADQKLLAAGKQPTGHAQGTIIRGSETGYYWGEPSSGGESLIPHGRDQRRRAIDLWRATGRIIGASADGGRGAAIIVSPGAVQVNVEVGGSNVTPAQIEALTRRATTDAMNQLTRQLTTGRR